MNAGRRKPAFRRSMACSLYKGVLLAALLAAGMSGAGQAQVSGPAVSGPRVPDNRDLRLDPEDSVPPAYRQTLDERDRQRLDAARESGATFLPVFQGPSAAPGDGAPAAAAPRDPAPSPPQPAYEGYRRPEPDPPHASGHEDLPPEELRAEGLRAEGLVGVLIEAWTHPPEIVRVRYPSAVGAPAARENRDVSQQADREPRAAAPGLRPEGLPHIAAGRGIYARTLYAVDSDYPGPVLLELLEPPLAGAVASGAFTLVGERLVLRLGRLEYRGRSFAVDAWAAGLGCACYGVRGEVDGHWFERVLLPSAARFAEGFLSVLSRPSETVTIGDGVRYERSGAAMEEAVHAGLATAARTAGDVLLESAPDGPTVRIPRDTELVVV